MFTEEDINKIRSRLLERPTGMEVVEGRPTCEIGYTHGGGLLEITWQPGDGTRYVFYAGVAPNLPGDNSDRLVISGRVGAAVFCLTLYKRMGYLAEYYVAEKGFSCLNKNPYMAKVLTHVAGAIADRTTEVDFGRV